MATFLLTTVGTAGDVFPFVVLARALVKRGHRVGLLANPYFEGALDFELARRPVTCGEFARFIEDGGYEDPRWWLSEGWARCQQSECLRPLERRSLAHGGGVGDRQRRSGRAR